jgi:hypothetical protein
MRYLQIPQDILVKDRIKGTIEKLSFVQYANLVWLNDARWEMPKTNLARLVKVVTEFDKTPGEWALLEDQEWTLLKAIIDTPGTGPNGPTLLLPLIQIQVGPVFEGAVLNAPTQDPREVIAPPVNGSGAAKEATS